MNTKLIVGILLLCTVIAIIYYLYNNQENTTSTIEELDNLTTEENTELQDNAVEQAADDQKMAITQGLDDIAELDPEAAQVIQEAFSEDAKDKKTSQACMVSPPCPDGMSLNTETNCCDVGEMSEKNRKKQQTIMYMNMGVGMAVDFAAQTAALAAAKTALRSGKKLAVYTASKLSKKFAAKVAAGQLGKEGFEKAAKELGEKAAKEAAERAGKEISQEAVEKAGEKAAKAAAKKLSGKVGKEAVEKAGQKIIQKATAKATAKASQAAARMTAKGAVTVGRSAGKAAAKSAAKGLMKLGKSLKPGPMMIFDMASMLADVIDIAGYGSFAPNEENVKTLEGIYYEIQKESIEIEAGEPKPQYPPLFQIAVIFPNQFNIALTNYTAERIIKAQTLLAEEGYSGEEIAEYTEYGDEEMEAFVTPDTAKNRDEIIYNKILGLLPEAFEPLIQLYPDYSTLGNEDGDGVVYGISLSKPGIQWWYNRPETKKIIQESYDKMKWTAANPEKSAKAQEEVAKKQALLVAEIEKEGIKLARLTEIVDELSEMTKVKPGPDYPLPVYSKEYYAVDKKNPMKDDNSQKKRRVKEGLVGGEVANKITSTIKDKIPNMIVQQLPNAIPQALPVMGIKMGCEDPAASANMLNMIPGIKKSKVGKFFASGDVKRDGVFFDPFRGVCEYPENFCNAMGGLKHRRIRDGRYTDCIQRTDAASRLGKVFLGETVTKGLTEIAQIIKVMKMRDLGKLATGCRPGYEQRGPFCLKKCELYGKGWTSRGEASMECKRACPKGTKSNGLYSCTMGKQLGKMVPRKTATKDCPPPPSNAQWTRELHDGEKPKYWSKRRALW